MRCLGSDKLLTIVLTSPTIQAHDGNIFVKSEQGNGSVFSFTLSIDSITISLNQQNLTKN
jgi:signal transduction histidine kinase